MAEFMEPKHEIIQLNNSDIIATSVAPEDTPGGGSGSGSGSSGGIGKN